MLPTLSSNDTIYICAPAKAIDEESILFAKNLLISDGFRVKLSPHVLGVHQYFSGTDEERLNDLQAGLDHPEAKAVLCARGGYGCIQLIEKLDWTLFQKNPKWIIGFSDITVLHLVLNKMKLPSLHATMPLNFKTNTPLSFSTLFSALKGENVEIEAPSHPKNRLGSQKKTIVGGNLAIVHAMLPYLDSSFFKDKILFLEDIGEHLYQIDRMFYGLRFHGALDNISGLILGGFTNISDTDAPFGSTLEEIILGHVQHREIPVGFGFPCGHQEDNQAIILGSIGEFIVDANGSRLIQPGQNALS